MVSQQSSYSLRQQRIAERHQAWDLALEKIDDVMRITEKNIDHLKGLLSDIDCSDSYLTSLTYYLFTGRRGLWIYSYQETFLLICRHPNIDDQMIFFNPNGLDDMGMENFIRQTPKDLYELRIGRVYGSIPDDTNRNFNLECVIEDILDWRYPVHILNTYDVTMCQGRRFGRIRNMLRRLDDHTIKTFAYDPLHHSRAIENLVHEWVSRQTQDKATYEDLYTPYDCLLGLSIDYPALYSGLMVEVDGKLEAVSLWDISNKTNKTANLFMSLVATPYKGLSEYLIVKSCEAANKDSILYMNLGGSEESGLNFFKQKFHPVQSLSLQTVRIDT